MFCGCCCCTSQVKEQQELHINRSSSVPQIDRSISSRGVLYSSNNPINSESSSNPNQRISSVSSRSSSSHQKYATSSGVVVEKGRGSEHFEESYSPNNNMDTNQYNHNYNIPPVNHGVLGGNRDSRRYSNSNKVDDSFIEETPLMKWERSIREYHECEEEVLHSHLIAPNLVKEVRSNPELFLSADVPEVVKELAHRRILERKYQSQFLRKGEGVSSSPAIALVKTELMPASSSSFQQQSVNRQTPSHVLKSPMPMMKTHVRRVANPSDAALKSFSTNPQAPHINNYQQQQQQQQQYYNQNNMVDGSSSNSLYSGDLDLSKIEKSSVFDSSSAFNSRPNVNGHAAAIPQSASRRMSKAWADRLANVLPLHGAMRQSQEQNVLKVKPRWPDWLVDESFDVIKVNKYGQKYQRTLKLTEYHVLGLREGAGVTKVYTYLDVDKVWLSNDGQSVSFSFKNDGRSFFYLTPFASHIAQQIATRVQVRVALENATFAINLPSIGYSSETMLNIINAISEENAHSNSSNFLSFAKILKNRVVPRPQNDNENGDDDNSESNPNSKNRSSARLDAEIRERRLLVIEQGTSEFHVQSQVRTILYDTSTPEGSTRRHFLDTFGTPEDPLLAIRLWIDGMHEYLLTKRGLELAKYFNNNNNNNNSDSSSSKNTSTVELHEIDEEILIVISFIIFTVVEESIFVPLLPGILAHIQTPDQLIREQDVVQKMEAMVGKTQQEFNIPEELISALGWRAAIFELAGVERNPTPSTRLNAVVRTAKAIYAEFNKEVRPRLELEGKKEIVLGADDLLPIFIFVLCHSSLIHPLLNKEILWGLCDPDQRLSECAYYLTVYESAVAFLEYGEGGEEREGNDDEEDDDNAKYTLHTSQSLLASVVSDLDEDIEGDEVTVSTTLDDNGSYHEFPENFNYNNEEQLKFENEYEYENENVHAQIEDESVIHYEENTNRRPFS